MTKQEINNRYTDLCGQIGHLTAGIKQSEAQILVLIQQVAALSNQMNALNQAEAALAAEAKAKQESSTAEAEAQT